MPPNALNLAQPTAMLTFLKHLAFGKFERAARQRLQSLPPEAPTFYPFR